MTHKLPLIFAFFICCIPLWGQKKVAPTKVVRVTQTKPVAQSKSVTPSKPLTQNKSVTPPKPVTKKKPVTSSKPGSNAKPVPRLKAVSVTPGISPLRMLRLNQRIDAQKSLYVLKNNAQILPLNRLDSLNVLVVNVGGGADEMVGQLIGRYKKNDYLAVDSKVGATTLFKMIPSSGLYNLVILVIGGRNGDNPQGKTSDELTEMAESKAETLLFEEREKQLLDGFSRETKVVCLVLGAPGNLDYLINHEKISAVVYARKNDFDYRDLSIQLLFGAIKSDRTSLASETKTLSRQAYPVQAINRLCYVLPEELGIDSVKMALQIDSLVGIGLSEKAFPGCQLLFAKEGKVFYQKSFGFHTYESMQPVKNEDLYDLASVTKILAPVPALMMLADQKKFLVTKRMSEYWPDWKGSNKENVLISDLLSHQARLRPGVLLWPNTMDGSGNYDPMYFATEPTPGYDLRVSKNLYLKDIFPDTVYKVIRDSPLLRTKRYVYSDIGFVLFPKLIEDLTGEKYESFLQQKLYARLGASTLLYNPYRSVPDSKIVPTEDDRNFRHELLQGFVHDETAALMGGISGNAGLFGSSGDVAKLLQLYLQNGEFGNERFISAETLRNWTSSHLTKVANRRGYGFDKPGIQVSRHTGKERYPSKVVSEQSYGHSGYTGTFVWVDPVPKLLFVFLSNRVYPDRDNHKINKLRIRPLLLESLFRLAGDKRNGN